MIAETSSPSNSKRVANKKFRKDKGPKEEVKEEYFEVDYVKMKPPAVFVDGYNIIGFMNRKGNRGISLEDARDCLISDLTVLRGATDWHIEVVFDVYKSIGHQSSSSVDNVIVTYTSMSETADNYIERRFEELKKDGFSNMIVATDDNVLRSIAGTSGAGFLSAAMIVEEFQIAYRGWELSWLQKPKKVNLQLV